MEYWHEMVTEKSWKLLQELKGKFQFTLIGGWAVYLWARTQKSKDIDIIVDIDTLQSIKSQYELRKNDALKKYEIKADDVDIDIYVPFYSKLSLPAENVGSAKVEGFDVARPEELLILKQAAEADRKHSEKGEKDRIDIMSLLLRCEIDWSRYRKIAISNNHTEFIPSLLGIVRSFTEYKYFGLLPSEFKKRKQEIIEKIRKL